MTRAHPAVTTISGLLDQQRQALLTGDFKALDQLPDRLERAMRHLLDSRPDGVTLSNVTRKAADNARLLVSAREGLSRARRDATETRPLTTYDASGRQQTAPTAGQIISRR
jgi:hypothetical protein